MDKVSKVSWNLDEFTKFGTNVSIFGWKYAKSSLPGFITPNDCCHFGFLENLKNKGALGVKTQQRLVNFQNEDALSAFPVRTSLVDAMNIIHYELDCSNIRKPVSHPNHPLQPLTFPESVSSALFPSVSESPARCTRSFTQMRNCVCIRAIALLPPPSDTLQAIAFIGIRWYEARRRRRTGGWASKLVFICVDCVCDLWVDKFRELWKLGFVAVRVKKTTTTKKKKKKRLCIDATVKDRCGFR